MKIGPRTRLVGALALLVIVMLAFAGCAVSSTSSSSSSTGNTGDTSAVGTGEDVVVVIEKSSFKPAVVNIKVGDTITFINRDRKSHRLALDATDMGNHGPLQKLKWVAEKPGTFIAKCTDQPSSATGKIVVAP